ncbi:MAG TPA: hypothetical protein VHS99_06085 [Chloroflexota bacterium]|nr:hypothetical protein [Chloroflexota bacterium]
MSPTESKKQDAAWLYLVHHTSAAGQKYVQSAPWAWDIATLRNVANDPKEEGRSRSGERGAR